MRWVELVTLKVYGKGKEKMVASEDLNKLEYIH